MGALRSMRLVDDGEGVVAVADSEMPVLTEDMVRATLERVRRFASRHDHHAVGDGYQELLATTASGQILGGPPTTH